MSAPDSNKILVIILGASEWPHFPSLPKSQTFVNSASGFADYVKNVLHVPDENVLSLFDNEYSLTETDRAVREFLRTNVIAKNISDLIIYYTGHGSFTLPDRKYIVMLRSTDKDTLDITAYKMSTLSNSIHQWAHNIRRWIILDCCSSAAAFVDFQPQAGQIMDVVADEAKKLFPPKGTALLCASSADEVALSPTDSNFTMFSGALLDTLKSGSKDLGDLLSLKEVHNLIENKIYELFQGKSVRPEIYTPDQREGDVALSPFFPNLARVRSPAVIDIAQIVGSDFLVLLSQGETEVEFYAETEHSTRNPQFLALRHVVRHAYRRLEARNLGEPFCLFAAEVVASEAKLEKCVQALCRAKVVILDATEFEPAIMFLAGIRAAVRRGVTLLSVGGEYALGKEINIPFNIKDANIVAHSREQNKSPVTDSVTLLMERIRRGLTEMGSPHYLDLPVYDAIRQLPADRRGIIPNEEGVLVLCPFDKEYETFWSNVLFKALQNEMNALRDAHIQVPPAVGVSRSLELNSPRLVTQTVYEAIRRMQSCVVDLTRWSPNVLFELGVRLVASGNRTVCIADRKWRETLPAAWKAQCEALASMFAVDEFLYDSAESWETQNVYSNAYGPDALLPRSGLLDGKLHALVEGALDVDCEPASRPVFVELQDQAALFSRDPGKSGRSKPVGLFPGNAELVRREETAEYERLLAAWLYVSYRYAPDEVLENASIRDPIYGIIRTLFERHADRLDASMRDALSKTWDKIDAWRAANG